MGETMNRTAIYGPIQLGEQPHLYEATLAAMKVVQDAGLIPKDRSTPSSGSLVAWIEDNGTAALAVFDECERDILWLDFIFVEPRHRRKGYATALIQRIATVAADNGIRKIMLGAHEQNEPMRRLGQACGYFTDHVVLTRAIAQPAPDAPRRCAPCTGPQFARELACGAPNGVRIAQRCTDCPDLQFEAGVGLA